MRRNRQKAGSGDTGLKVTEHEDGTVEYVGEVDEILSILGNVIAVMYDDIKTLQRAVSDLQERT